MFSSLLLWMGKAILNLAVLALLFWVLEKLWPEDREQSPWHRRDALQDVIWWFLSYGTLFLATIGAAILAIVLLQVIPAPHPLLPQIVRQPVWLQSFETVLVVDFISYWIHRLFHNNRVLWPFHAIHHSSEKLNWLSSSRAHPVDIILRHWVSVALLYLLGFSGKFLVPFSVFLVIYPLVLHANLSWRFGPLRYIFVSPAFHRWHHTAQENGLNKNFSGIFAFFDYLFGTAYLPEYQPTWYGIYRKSGRMPQTVLAQLLYPFHQMSRRRRHKQENPAAVTDDGRRKSSVIQ